MSSSSASSVNSLFSEPIEEWLEFTLPLPEEGDVLGECEWYHELYRHHYWMKKLGFPNDFVIISTDLLRGYITRFVPHVNYDLFFKPGPYYTLGPLCDVIEISFGGEKSERFENIRRHIVAEGPRCHCFYKL